MPGSFKKIDYRLRPAKHAERIMLIDLFKRMRFAPIETYQYVGFGSVAFIDFRMVHRALGVKDLISIEATDDPDEQSRFTNNSPYAGLTLHFGHSNSVLPALDLSKRSLVWLDYDGALSRSMANDLAIIGRRIPSGSFVGVTFTTAFPTTSPAREDELKRLKDDFPDFLAEDIKAKAFDGAKSAEFGRATLNAVLEKAVLDADAGEPDPSKRRTIRQICYFKYQDGVPMVTVGWIVLAEIDKDVFDDCRFDALPFVRTGTDAFKVKIPIVTPLEVRAMERKLPGLAVTSDLVWIPTDERSKFDSIYRYLPVYSVVEDM